jgi:hypothetical protein
VLRWSALAVAVTVVLVIGGGALAHALWAVREPMPDVRITAGDFDATAWWVDEPALVGLFPGGSTSQLCLELTLSEGTPSQLQGETAEVEVVVTVEQVR